MRPVKRCAVLRKESGRREANGLRRKELELPFPVSPPGQAGAGGFPPRREHAARQPKRRHASMHPAPPTRGLPPPCVSPARAPQALDYTISFVL